MVDTTTIADPTTPSIFWPTGSPEGLSYEQLKQRRAIAAALASRSRPYPTTIGQGLTALGEGLADAFYEKRTNEYERQQRELDRKAREDAGGAGATPPPPAARRTSTLDVVDPVAVAGGGSTSTNAAVADSGPDIKDDMTATILAQQGVLPGQAPQQRVRMAALDTGTMSDAGQPGLTYGGSQAAGPGASMMEPPTTAPPTPTAPSVAANAAAQQPAGPAGTPGTGVAGGGPAGPPAPVGTDAVAGSLLAQVGAGAPVPRPMPAPPPPPAPVPRGDIRVRPTPPPAPAQPAPGTMTQPPAAGAPAPQTFPETGQTPMNPPLSPGPRPPRPEIGRDTPDMARIKATLANPAFRDISPNQREQLTEAYKRLKESRDKQDSEDMAEWSRLDQNWLTLNKEYQEKIRTQPKERLDLSKETDAETIRRRWTTPENFKQTVENAKASTDKAKTLSDSLPNLYKAMDILKNKTIVAGFGAQTSPLALNTPVGNIGMPSNMSWHGLWGSLGSQNSKEAVENTQEFRALMRPMVKAMLQQTTGAGAISNAEIDQAMEGLGIAGNLEKPAMIKIIENLRENAYRQINEHNSKVNDTFNVPSQDKHHHTQFKVDLPKNPDDVMMLRATPNSPQERARFDKLYGPGSAARELGYGR